MNNSEDSRAALARTLAETHLEAISAEHDYRKLLSEGSDFMQQRFGAHILNERPDLLDLWSEEMDAMRQAKEKGGLQEIPNLPYQPRRTIPL